MISSCIGVGRLRSEYMALGVGTRISDGRGWGGGGAGVSIAPRQLFNSIHCISAKRARILILITRLIYDNRSLESVEI